MLNNKPVIAITMGDPASIGPEVAVKALAKSEIHEICNPLIVGDAKVIQKTLDELKVGKNINIISDIKDAKFETNEINVFHLELVDVEKLEMGKVSATAGEAAFQSVKKVIELALDKKVDATVTAPLHKESINLAGHKFSGHTEIYAHYTNTKKYAMLLVEENFRVIHVSTHVSLKEAVERVKKERIYKVIKLAYNALRNLGIENPRIAVAGLNPHAGEHGLFGTEEMEEITPAINKAQKENIDVEGPIPPDTVFSKARGG